MSQAYDAALRPSGLKATQFTLLAVLAGRGALPLTKLSEALVMDRTTLSEEYWIAHRELGLTRDELDRVILNTFRSAFLDEGRKAGLIAEVRKELSEIT